MKLPGKIAVCMVGSLILAPALWADDAPAPAADSNPLPDNPYSSVVVRNVFNLNPPTATEVLTEINPPSKITPTGIQDFLGIVKALFKVAGVARPGVGAQDKYYMLAEGQREDDIEVKHIDRKNKIVTFDNHGTVQELPLTAAASTGPSGGGPLPGGNNPTGFNPQNGGNENPQGRGFGRFGRGFNRGNNNNNNNNNNNEANNNGGNESLNLRPIPTRGDNTFNTYQPSEAVPKMTPEEQVIMMEYNRAKSPAQAPIIPPTPITPAMNGDQ